MTTKPILLIGSSVRAATESAVRAGFSVVACDHFGDRETLAAANRWIPWGQFDQFENEHFECIFASGVYGTPPILADSVQQFRHATPTHFAQVSSPEFLRQLAEDSAAQFPDVSQTRPRKSGWLEKHRYSTGGLGVRWAQTTPLDSSPRRILDNQERYFQRFQFGRVFGASYVADGATAALVGVCRSIHRTVSSMPFFYVGSVGPVAVSDSVGKVLQELGHALIQKTQLTGPVNLDVIIHDDHVTLLEVNPRWSASMEIVERGWMDAVNQPCSLFEPLSNWKERLDKHPVPVAKWVKRYVLARHETLVDPSQFCESDEAAPWYWKDVPSNAVTVKASEPIATLLVNLDVLSAQKYRQLLSSPFA